MKLQVFSLRYDVDSGRFDNQAVQDFFHDHTAISISDHMVIIDGLPVLVLLVTYREKQDSIRVIPPVAREEIILADPDKPLFAALRKWRNDRAKREGRPSYVIFTNFIGTLGKDPW
jgi:hypothetical protein